MPLYKTDNDHGICTLVIRMTLFRLMKRHVFHFRIWSAAHQQIKPSRVLCNYLIRILALSILT